MELSPALKAEIDHTAHALGITEARDSAKDCVTALGEVRALLDRGGRLLTPMLRAPDRSRRIAMLGAVVAGPFLIGAVISLIGHEQLGWLSWATTLLGSGAAWLRSQAAWVSKWLGRAERAQQQLDKQAAEHRARQAEQIAKLEKNLELTRTKYAAAKNESLEKRRRVEEAKAQLAATIAGRLLATFIQDRAASTDYRKHLGLLAVVRKDIEYMSKLIAAENDSLENFESVEGEQVNANVRINRIVLYIDDLDRCPPEKVVQVLQAVHLLGSFPLFVIVVAVDARWISRALAAHYKEVLGDGKKQSEDFIGIGRDATPHDYLEKVFQVPFWIRPMGESGAASMLGHLLREVVAPNGGKSDGKTTPQVGSVQAGSQISPDAQNRQASSTTSSGSQSDSAEQSKAGAAIDLNPESLKMRPQELEFMKALRPLLGHSPRALKRFLNVYRLLKAGVPSGEQEAFTRDAGPESPFQIVLFLLAIVTGTRTLSRPMFSALANGTKPIEEEGKSKRKRPVRRQETLESILRSLQQEQGQIAAEELDALKRWLETPELAAWKKASVEPFATWAWRVSRYSFRVEALA